MEPHLAIYLEEARAVYVEVPKVACTSIKVALAPLLGVDLARWDGNPHEAEFPAPRPPSTATDRLYPGSWTFAFVRNPWDRLVSCYRDKILGEVVDGFTFFTDKPGVANCLADFDAFYAGMSFDAFVDAVAGIPDADADPHFRSQFTFLTRTPGRSEADFVGRFERLAEDFGRVVEDLGLPASVRLPHLQAARRPARYVDYYDASTRARMTRRYAEDIELFGYRFD